MDFDDHEDPEGGLEMAVQQGGYDSLTGSRQRMGPNSSGDGTAGPRKLGPAHIRYRECLKNHALSLGGHAVDGCGEFMAAGEEGTLDALKCAACNCHRNFHRKETEGTEGGSGLGIYHHLQHHPAAQQQHHLNHFSAYYRAPPPSGYLHLTPPPQQHRPLALPAASGGGYSREEEDVSNPSSSGGAGGLRKRRRTKFTAEQKEKMLALAERLGWRIQKHDEAAVEEFCEETGVKRHVLKVWMHNNKHTLGGKKQEQQQPS